MQAFVHLTLFALLFVISATSATSPTTTVISGNTNATSASTPTDANSTVPTSASTPTDANSTVPTSASTPTDANSTVPTSATSPTTIVISGNTNATSASTPTDANSTVPTSASTPTDANSTVPTSASTPTDANSTVPTSASTPTDANSTMPTSASTPTDANSTVPTSASTPTDANSTMPTSASTPTDANSTVPTPSTPMAPAGTNNTTPTPATPTAPTTFIKDSSPGTVPSVTSSSVTSLKTSNPNPDTTNLCQLDTCGGGSYCVSLNSTPLCLCIDGSYYNSSSFSCNKGKVFPGIIQVKTPDTSGLENKKSKNYENLHKKVDQFFTGVFKDSDYGQTVIQNVSIPVPGRSQMRAGDEVVSVRVVNLFAEATKQNEMTISAAIHNAISNNSSIASYTNQDRCEFYGCINETDCNNVLQCKCREGYERPTLYTATCLPLSRRCPYACKSTPNMQCLAKDDGSPDCVCMAGYKKDGQEKCQACAFGYNGVNCEDNFQLILTILGTIAGILILGMVIALIFMRSKKTKDIEEQHLIENDFQNLKLQQTTGFSFPAEGSIFPKVTAGFPRDLGVQNPYANPRGMPRPDY